MPFFGEKNGFLNEKQAKWGGPSGHLTWPLNPPTKKQTKKKTKKQKKTQKHLENELFSYQSIVLVGVHQNFPIFDILAQKARTQKKHYKNWGFSKACFAKQMCVTKRPSLDQKTKKQKFQLSLFGAYSFLFQQENTKIGWNPTFIVF